jgi:hypothetical protein
MNKELILKSKIFDNVSYMNSRGLKRKFGINKYVSMVTDENCYMSHF